MSEVKYFDTFFDSVSECTRETAEYVSFKDYEKLEKEKLSLITYIEKILIPTNKTNIVRIPDTPSEFYKECFDTHIVKIDALKKENTELKSLMSVQLDMKAQIDDRDALIDTLKEVIIKIRNNYESFTFYHADELCDSSDLIEEALEKYKQFKDGKGGRG